MPDNINLEALQKMLDKMEKRLDKKFDKIDERFDKVEDKVSSLTSMTERNTIVLEEHQRRSLALEKHVDLIQAQVNDNIDSIEANQKELASSVELFVKLPKFLYKVAVWVAALGAASGVMYGTARFIITHFAK